MKSLKILFLSCLALGATALTAFSQASVGTAGSGSSYTANFLPFYPNSFNPTNAALQTIFTVPASAPPANGTNLMPFLGWTNTTYLTNNQGPLYTNNLNGTGSPGFYTNVVIITNNSVTYPQIYIPKQSRIALEYVGTVNGAGSPTNLIFTFARSVTGRNGLPDTSHTIPWSVMVSNNAAGQWTVGVTNFSADSIGGEGYLDLVGEFWQSTNGTILTNYDGGLYYGLKPNSGN